MKVTFVKSARKDNPNHGIKKGDSYYWWQHAFRPKEFSKTAPTRSQLTSSDFLKTLYGIQDTIENLSADSAEDLSSQIDDIKSEIESLRDETQDKLDNMPDQLREASQSGEMLSERVEALESWISDLDSIDLDYEEEDGLSKAKKAESLREFIDNAIQEVQSTDPGL